MTADGRPNILLLMVDQLAASWPPIYELQRRARLPARTPPSTRLSPRSLRALRTVGQGHVPAPRRRVSLVGEEEEP